MQERYNTAEEEAKRLKRPVTWIWKKARNGEIPAYKIGKYYFFIPEEVDSWIKEHAQSA